MSTGVVGRRDEGGKGRVNFGWGGMTQEVGGCCQGGSAAAAAE